MDRSLNATVARYSTGLSPMALVSAYWDWASHLAFAPGKRLQLSEKAAKKSLRLANYVMRRAMHLDGMTPCIEPLPQDRRFINDAWRVPPYDVDLSVVPDDAAMVAQRDDRRSRRHQEARKDGRVRRAAIPGHGFAGQFHSHQPRGSRPHAAAGRHEPAAGSTQLGRGLGPRIRRQAPGGRRCIPGRPRRG